MSDEQFEQRLRNLPAPELPPAWRAEIVGRAVREGRAQDSARSRFSLVVLLRNIFAKNPYTATALTAFWLLIFLFHATTPVDPTEQAMLARVDPSKPVYLVDLVTEIRLAELSIDSGVERPERIP